MIHLIHTKEQLEYVRLNKEYDFVKKRALVNFLSNSRSELENHFHSRAQNMLLSIERYEQANLKNLLNSIGNTISGNGIQAIEILATTINTNTLPNAGDGIYVQDSARTVIGGADLSLGNLIGPNRGHGVHLSGRGSAAPRARSSTRSSTTPRASRSIRRRWRPCRTQATSSIGRLNCVTFIG